MRPLSELAAGAEGPPFDTLVFDLDDTFLDGQILNADAYLALERLQAAGLGLVACTGGRRASRKW